MAQKFGTPRRTVLLESSGQTATAAAPLEVADDPCWVLLSATGLLARTSDDSPLGDVDRRVKHDTIVAAVRTTARGQIGVVTSDGRIQRLACSSSRPSRRPPSPPTCRAACRCASSSHLDGDRPLALMTFDDDGPGLALGTRAGVVKRVKPDHLSNRDAWDLISLADGDEVVGAVACATGDEQLAFVTSDAQLLRFAASVVRPQGRAGGGVAGVKLAAGRRAVVVRRVRDVDSAHVVTIAGSGDALPGTQNGGVKVSPLAIYPAKGRATGGVRCQRLLKGEDGLMLAWVGDGQPMAAPPADRRSTCPSPPIVATAPVCLPPSHSWPCRVPARFPRRSELHRVQD